MKFKQTTPYGCGMYAVANALNLDNYVSEERLDKSKNGNSIMQLNRWLNESGINFNIECMYYTVFQNEKTGHGIQLPKEVFCYSDDSNKTIPILINVQKCELSKTHLIGAWIHTDSLTIIDSVKDDLIHLRWDELNNYYKYVYGFWIFQDQELQSGYVCFEKGNTQIKEKSAFQYTD